MLVAEVDCEASCGDPATVGKRSTILAGLCKRQGVTAFPTLLLFEDGAQVIPTVGRAHRSTAGRAVRGRAVSC